MKFHRDPLTSSLLFLFSCFSIKFIYTDFLEVKIIILFLILFTQSKHLSSKKRYHFDIIYKWKQIEYKFRSEEERSEAIKNGSFLVGKITPLDTQYVYDADTDTERMFVTTPRFTKGVPATLGIVTNETRDGNPIIDPYPSWSWHINIEKCNYYRIVSVFRVWVDECNRLWVIDHGGILINNICPPQLLTFDLKTNKLLYRYEIPFGQHENLSLFVTPVTEVESRKNACENTWVYICSPQLTPSLIVYNLKQNTSWRVQDKSFLPDPKYYNFTVDGETFTVNDGLITLAVTPPSEGPRRLRYHSLANVIEGWVYTKYLKNPKNFPVPFGSPQFFHVYKHKRNQQSSVEALDRKGNMYFSLIESTEMVKWDPRTTFKQENFQVIARNPETLQFPGGVKIIPYKNESAEVLWVLTCAFQRLATGTLFGNRTNFRVLRTFL